MKMHFPFAAAIAFSLAAPAFAAGIPTNTGPESVRHVERVTHGDQWKKDHKPSPEQQRRHEEMKKRWQNASPDERARMKEHHKKRCSHGDKPGMHEKMKNATPEEREQMRLRFEEKRRQWETMSPEERASAKARRTIGQGGTPAFQTPGFTPRSTEGGVTELPRRHQAK